MELATRVSKYHRQPADFTPVQSGLGQLSFTPLRASRRALSRLVVLTTFSLFQTEYTSMLQIESVHKQFSTKVLLNGASAHLRPQSRVGLVGPNGTGKTTLF